MDLQDRIQRSAGDLSAHGSAGGMGSYGSGLAVSGGLLHLEICGRTMEAEYNYLRPVAGFPGTLWLWNGISRNFPIIKNNKKAPFFRELRSVSEKRCFISACESREFLKKAYTVYYWNLKVSLNPAHF